jgi:hypothetical protein
LGDSILSQIEETRALRSSPPLSEGSGLHEQELRNRLRIAELRGVPSPLAGVVLRVLRAGAARRPKPWRDSRHLFRSEKLQLTTLGRRRGRIDKVRCCQTERQTGWIGLKLLRPTVGSARRRRASSKALARLAASIPVREAAAHHARSEQG